MTHENRNITHHFHVVTLFISKLSLCIRITSNTGQSPHIIVDMKNSTTIYFQMEFFILLQCFMANLINMANNADKVKRNNTF